MNELAQFLTYAIKVFAINRVVRNVRCSRIHPVNPTRVLSLSLLMGAVLRVGSYLDLSKQTKRRRWQHLIHWPKRISDDAFHYVSERYFLDDWRHSLAQVAKTLKAKALESCKINGLLFLSLDANEHFHSRSRCCPCCCRRNSGPPEQKHRESGLPCGIADPHRKQVIELTFDATTPRLVKAGPDKEARFRFRYRPNSELT
jgi:hypothetical protein